MKLNYNHVEHYESSYPPCIDFTFYLPFTLGNILKYLYRCNMKGTKDADLFKAKEYLKIFKSKILDNFGNVKVLDYLESRMIKFNSYGFTNKYRLDLIDELMLNSTIELNHYIREKTIIKDQLEILLEDDDNLLNAFTEPELRASNITVPNYVYEIYREIIILELLIVNVYFLYKDNLFSLNDSIKLLVKYFNSFELELDNIIISL